MKMKEGEDSSSKEIRDEARGKKIEYEEGSHERNTLKKVEIPIFNAEDPNSWLFRVDKNFQIHELMDFEKIIVAIISFDGPALYWYRS